MSVTNIYVNFKDDIYTENNGKNGLTNFLKGVSMHLSKDFYDNITQIFNLYIKI